MYNKIMKCIRLWLTKKRKHYSAHVWYCCVLYFTLIHFHKLFNLIYHCVSAARMSRFIPQARCILLIFKIVRRGWKFQRNILYDHRLHQVVIVGRKLIIQHLPLLNFQYRKLSTL